MKYTKFKYLSADFETTVYDGQDNTEVWAAACVELYTEDVHIFHSIGEQFDYFKSLKENLCVYYHNLKFDGAFWLSYLMIDLKYTQAVEQVGDQITDVRWLENEYMTNNSFKYRVSDMGQWYSITIKTGNRIIEIRDSLKLLPFSVKEIGNSFKTKHQKLDMEYTGFRFAGCVITDEEKKYIANDVLVVKEALEIMFNQGHKRLTIGACCLHEYKQLVKCDYDHWFPNLTEIELDESFGSRNAEEYVRKSYRGGWCYLVYGKENQEKHNGVTADVNSLYPSMMSSESGNYYPVGKPRFWKGNKWDISKINNSCYFFVRVKTRFYLKEGKLPFIQIKNTPLYPPNECLFSSDVYDSVTGEWCTEMVNPDGTIRDTRVTLTFTQTDYILFREHYDVVDFEVLDGCWFNAEIGIFDAYIEKYKKIKLESKGALRTLAKLFLNNLYGKMATSTNSSFKYAYVKPDGVIGFLPVAEHDKTPVYIPCGSAITSYARNFTIRAAQANYYGVDKRGFIYADTDSIHCDLSPDEIKGIRVHDKNFCCWKLESCWDDAIFVRQKTYVEHITHEDLKRLVTPYYNIKCAGMPQKCKKLFGISIGEEVSEAELDSLNLTKEDMKFLETKRTIKDFKIGLKVSGKLLPKRIKGGILLKETTFEMR